MGILQIAEAAKLKPLELELKKLEDLSDAIVQDFALMRKREEEMRDTNGNDKLRTICMKFFSNESNFIFQNQRITEFYSSVYLECVVYLVSQHGKFFILEDISFKRNLLRSELNIGDRTELSLGKMIYKTNKKFHHSKLLVSILSIWIHFHFLSHSL
jgi:hypothetical protein